MLEIPNDRGVFTLEIKVQSADIDEQNHVNNVVYVKWIQEVAYAHWKTLGSPELLDSYKWVVIRHEIDYHASALPNDTVIASTWIDKPEGARQRRFVTIHRMTDNKQLTSATTTWCLLDARTGRPKRVTDEITSVFGLKN